MDDLPTGAVVEVGPGRSRPKPSDRTISEVARGASGGLIARAAPDAGAACLGGLRHRPRPPARSASPVA